MQVQTGNDKIPVEVKVEFQSDVEDNDSQSEGEERELHNTDDQDLRGYLLIRDRVRRI